jgi:hypothetical protein
MPAQKSAHREPTLTKQHNRSGLTTDRLSIAVGRHCAMITASIKGRFMGPKKLEKILEMLAMGTSA